MLAMRYIRGAEVLLLLKNETVSIMIDRYDVFFIKIIAIFHV